MKGEATHIMNSAKDIEETTNAYIANHTHDVFDKSSTIADSAENVIDEALHKTHDVIDKALNETRQKIMIA